VHVTNSSVEVGETCGHSGTHVRTLGPCMCEERQFLRTLAGVETFNTALHNGQLTFGELDIGLFAMFGVHIRLDYIARLTVVPKQPQVHGDVVHVTQVVAVAVVPGLSHQVALQKEVYIIRDKENMLHIAHSIKRSCSTTLYIWTHQNNAYTP
jgi:hypothetical protein